MMMKAALTLTALALAMPVYAQDAQSTERIEFAHGIASTTVSGRVTDHATIAYLVSARAGQNLTVSMMTNNTSSYFNVTAPGAGEAIFMGHLSGNRFTSVLPSTGDYTIQVYLMRNAARRNEIADYTLTIDLR